MVLRCHGSVINLIMQFAMLCRQNQAAQITEKLHSLILFRDKEDANVLSLSKLFCIIHAKCRNFVRNCIIPR